MALTIVPPPPPDPPASPVKEQIHTEVPDEHPVLRNLGEYLASYAHGHPDFRPLRPGVPVQSVSLIPYLSKLGLDPDQVRAVFVEAIRNPVSEKPKVENRFLMCLGCCVAKDVGILSVMRTTYLEGRSPHGVEASLRVVMLGHALLHAGLQQTINMVFDLIGEVRMVADAAAASPHPRVRALGFALQASLWDHFPPE